MTAEMVDTTTGEILSTAKTLATIDPSDIDRAADPAAFVVMCCERAKTWLAQAVEQGDIESIVETKSQAEAIRVYTMQKQLGKDTELAAAEIVRRAERGIGVAIRRGQEAGLIKRRGDTDYRPAQDGRVPTNVPDVFAHKDERQDIYAMTDGVSDEQFEQAITQAKAEENLSRAHVKRKIKGEATLPTGNSRDAVAARVQRARDLAESRHSSRQIAAALGMTEEGTREMCRREGIEVPADKILGRTRRHDANRIVEQTVLGLEGHALALDLIDFEALDPTRIAAWSGSLAASLQSLNRLSRRLKELDQA